MLIIKREPGKATICKQQEPLFYKTNIWDFAVTPFQAFPVTPFLVPFPEKMPLKLQKGAHWAFIGRFLG